MGDTPHPSLAQPTAPPSATPRRRKSNVDQWGMSFKTQVERCWKKPAGERESMEVILAIRLKRDGTIDTLRMVSSLATTASGKSYQAHALRAITDCQPYDLPDEDYDEWRHFEPVFVDRRP